MSLFFMHLWKVTLLTGSDLVFTSKQHTTEVWQHGTKERDENVKHTLFSTVTSKPARFHLKSSGISVKRFSLYLYPTNSSFFCSCCLQPTGGKPGTRRRWRTSTPPSGSPAPVWGTLCPLAPLSPVQRWWQLLWSRPGHLRRPKSRASRSGPSSPRQVCEESGEQVRTGEKNRWE